jgi:hypothetical protein
MPGHCGSSRCPCMRQLAEVRAPVTPEREQCSIAPPRSSADTSSPVAAFTSGGPPRKIVPLPRTMTVSSAIAGTYAPPAVHEPMTTAICGIPAADILACALSPPQRSARMWSVSTGSSAACAQDTEVHPNGSCIIQRAVAAPGCRRCDQNGHDQERHRLAWEGLHHPSPLDRYMAVCTVQRPLAIAGASSR